MGDVTFVLGPARSGKSAFAEHLAMQYGDRVLYLATLQPLDLEMQRRVKRHRATRPRRWSTLEEPIALVARLAAQPAYDVCLLDCLTLWVSNLLLDLDAQTRDERPEDAVRQVLQSVQGLIDWQLSARAPMIVVSNEVGGGIVPEYPLGRLYRDTLGGANQMVAQAARCFYYLVSGYYLDLKALGAQIVPRRAP